MEKNRRIGVVGSGTMGSGIAQVFAQCGHDVNLIDVDVVEGRIVPRRLRERIRAGGPTITVNADLPAGGNARRAA